MRDFGSPTTTILTGTMGMFIVLLAGCCPAGSPFCCANTHVTIVTDEYLSYDGEIPTPETGGLSLEVAVVHDSGDEVVREWWLHYEEGSGLLLPHMAQYPLPTGPLGHCPDLDDITVWFDVVGLSENVDGVDHFPLLEVEGGETQADLWDGWTVELDWLALLIIG